MYVRLARLAGVYIAGLHLGSVHLGNVYLTGVYLIGVHLSHRRAPEGRDEAVAQEGAQNSVKKGVHFRTHRPRVSVHASHEALTLHSPVAHPGSPCSRGASV
jgi:hypothetical protein